MHKVEIRKLVGNMRESATGNIRRVAWNDIEQVILNGRQVATINTQPGVPIALLAGVVLKPAETKAVSDAIAAARGGVAPAAINSPIQLPYEYLDDEPDTEVEGDDVGE